MPQDIINAFPHKHDFLVCVDSDGCAMDTMDIKHRRCFGPCMVTEWNLEAWSAPILARWNEINLYTMTRGINRFKALAIALKEIDQQYAPIPGAAVLAEWAAAAPELSNRSVQAEYQRTGCEIFHKALRWSEATNAAIAALPLDEKQPFPGAVEGLATAHAFADVVVVSSANRDAVETEWRHYGLLQHVDLLLCQDAGSKAHCLAALLQKGYDPQCSLLVGDAPGDQAAAKKSGVFFYPILVRHEAESWRMLCQDALPHLQCGTYEAYGAQCCDAFLANLKGE